MKIEFLTVFIFYALAMQAMDDQKPLVKVHLWDDNKKEYYDASDQEQFRQAITAFKIIQDEMGKHPSIFVNSKGQKTLHFKGPGVFNLIHHSVAKGIFLHEIDMRDDGPMPHEIITKFGGLQIFGFEAFGLFKDSNWSSQLQEINYKIKEKLGLKACRYHAYGTLYQITKIYDEPLPEAPFMHQIPSSSEEILRMMVRWKKLYYENENLMRLLNEIEQR